MDDFLELMWGSVAINSGGKIHTYPRILKDQPLQCGCLIGEDLLRIHPIMTVCSKNWQAIVSSGEAKKSAPEIFQDAANLGKITT